MTLVHEKIDLRYNGQEYKIQIVKPPVATVELVTYTHDPTRSMASVIGTYKGYMDVYANSEAIKQAMEDIQKTKLQTPLEMIHFLWLIKDVTRAFTHQLVRYRVGTSFAQESMRFYGVRNVYRVLLTGYASANPYLQKVYSDAVVTAIDTYELLLRSDTQSQDARGILPTNILTSIFFDCSLRTLQNIFNQRMCCQAQRSEWMHILIAMRKKIRSNLCNELADLLTGPRERGENCGYHASFDRPCEWKPGVIIDEDSVLKSN